jgi:glycosyltransferase involved in cell wall biosynthesis
MSKINILRQYPAASHNRPIRRFADKRGYDVDTYEYDLESNIGRLGPNLRYIVRSLLWERNQTVVLGAEPFDPRVPLFHRLARRHDVVLHTSWPYWESAFVPQTPRFAWQRRRWRAFLGDIRAVGVTRASVDSVSRFGNAEAAYIPHAVDTTTYRPSAASIHRDEPIVLFVGRLERRKGIEVLLRVIRDWQGPSTRFWFVGDGPLAPQVSSAARANELVEYFGFVSDDDRLADIYASADVFTLPSYRVAGWEELFGIVVIEALASGLPVVATDCAGPAEIIDVGETGYIVKQHDGEELRERLEMLVATPRGRSEMSENARSVALERYEADTVSEQWGRALNP